jgi:virulence-associated protein VagC
MPGTEVTVRRVGTAIILEPLRAGWSEEFVQFLLSPPDELLARSQPKRHERERIDL